MDTIELIAIAAFVAIALVLVAVNQARLNDPSDETTIYTHEVAKHCKVRSGPVRVTLIRQSMNVYRELGHFDTLEEGLAELTKSLNRAGITDVRVWKNEPTAMQVIRTFKAGRKNEGKTLGGGLVEAVSLPANQTWDKPRIVGLSARIKSADPNPNDDGAFHYEFEFHCEECGGWEIKVPDEGAADGPVSCTACGKVFGQFSDLQTVLSDLAQEDADSRN